MPRLLGALKPSHHGLGDRATKSVACTLGKGLEEWGFTQRKLASHSVALLCCYSPWHQSISASRHDNFFTLDVWLFHYYWFAWRGMERCQFFFCQRQYFLPSHNGVFQSQVSSLSTTSLLQVINNHGGEIGTIKSAVPLLKRRCWQCTLVKVQPIKHWGGGITRKRENVRLKMCLLQPNSMHLLVALQQFFTLMFNSLTDFFSNYSLPGNYCYYFLLMPL